MAALRLVLAVSCSAETLTHGARLPSLISAAQWKGSNVKKHRLHCEKRSRASESSRVENMEQYLENLSLEYESVWDTKPSWCQPWSIILTGVLAIAASWLVFRFIPLTSVVALAIAAWWFVFLYSYPLAYAQMIAERRREIERGEDSQY